MVAVQINIGVIRDHHLKRQHVVQILILVCFYFQIKIFIKYFFIEERCNLARTNGEGNDLIPRWYYDFTLRKCKRFLYKGLKGNPNNFITSIQCMETCETGFFC